MVGLVLISPAAMLLLVMWLERLERHLPPHKSSRDQRAPADQTR